VESPLVKESILNELKSRVSSNAFETFCKRFEFQPTGENSYTIPVPNKFYKEMMERDFKRLLEEAFLKVFGKVPDIAFEISEASQSSDEVSYPPDTSSTEVFTSRSGLCHLNKDYIFENFVVGQSNRFAHAGALSIAEEQSGRFNPIFIYGSVGLGKTHLLQAICHRILQRKPGIDILYTSGEEFVNEYIYALNKKKLEEFRNRYRKAHILIIDDIHFLGDKERSQEEFFHTFNTLYTTNRSVVLSSDSSPRDIATLEERLLSRFTSGFVAKIEQPEYETRVAILKKKAEMRGKVVPEDVIDYIATNVQTNIRELESAINKVVFYYAIEGRIDLDLAKIALGDSIETKQISVSLSKVVQVVSEYFGISSDEITAKHWTKFSSLPRQVAMYLAREYTSHSLKEISSFFGRKDHGTCIYSVIKVKELLKKNKKLKSDMEYIIKKLKSR
jgi:chromosomal replication initiator protein